MEIDETPMPSDEADVKEANRLRDAVLAGLRQGAGGAALAEMANAVAKGELSLEEAVATDFYGSSLMDGVVKFAEWRDSLSPEELAAHTERAARLLNADDQ